MRFEKASCMTDPAMVPETQDVAETTHFLRRFAGLMANGQNAAYLHRTADLLEALTARVSASSDEEQLWRYKYETLSQQNDALERECEELRHDIERHVKLSSSIIAERDVHKTTLDAREAELRELGEALKREREALKQERQRLVTQSQAHTVALAEQLSAFDQERSALQAKADASSREIDQLRGDFERDREELSVELARHQMELTELRAAFDRERDGLKSSLKSREDELAEVRADVAREQGALNDKAEALEAKRVELRSAFERISQLRVEPAAPGQDRDSLREQNSTVVPKETLRQARAQFEFLARECVRRGDVATQAMCELGAHSIDLALVAEQHPASVGEALSILEPILSPHPAPRISAEN
jgi:chromosome segregation ATPase